MLAKYRPDLAGSPETLLALRYDPVLSTQMIGALVAENADILAKAGHEATPGNIYLAHFAGRSGAVTVLNADPSTAVRSILKPDAIAAEAVRIFGRKGRLRVRDGYKAKHVVIEKELKPLVTAG